MDRMFAQQLTPKLIIHNLADPAFNLTHQFQKFGLSKEKPNSQTVKLCFHDKNELF
jgi:hypothetical protein